MGNLDLGPLDIATELAGLKAEVAGLRAQLAEEKRPATDISRYDPEGQLKNRFVNFGARPARLV